MIITRYSYDVPMLAGRPVRRLGASAADTPYFVPMLLLGALTVGALGIAVLEWQQGWRPGRRR